MRAVFCGFMIPTTASHPRVPPRQNHVSETTDKVPRNNNKVPRNNNTVPRNNPVTQSSDTRMHAPLENIASSMWYNSALSSRSSDCPLVPRNNVKDGNNEQQKTVSPSQKEKKSAI